MRAIRMFYRRINFNSTQTQRGKCVSSLMHSLRIKTSKIKTLEWQDELADENLIWRDGEVKKLTQLTEVDKLMLLDSIAPNRSMINKKMHQNNRRKYKLKLKNAIESETNKGHVNAVNIMSDLLDYEDNSLISESYLEKLKLLDMTRKNQRLKMLETYIKAHNALNDNVANANAVFVQEGLFKIPHKWHIGTDIIDKESYITIVKDFLTHHFPDYPIKAIVCHHDERTLDEDTGAHSHYFISGKNNRTNCFDLHKTQIKRVNEFIKQVGDNDDRLPKSAQLNRQQSKVFGEYFQRMFYDFVNERLLNPNDLVAEFTKETEKKSVIRREMNRESALPKGQRSHNLHTRQAELVKNKLGVLLSQQKIEKVSLNSLQQDTQAKKKQLAFLKIKTKQASSEFKDFSNQVSTKQNEVEALDVEISELRQTLTELTLKVTSVIVNICKQIYVSTVSKERGFNKRASEFSKNILLNYLSLSSSGGRKIVQVAAKSLDDELFETANKNNALANDKREGSK
jgi:hypothetical protein